MTEGMDRVVAVTGAFGNLGTAVAHAFAAGGAKVALIDFTPSPPVSVQKEFGPTHLLLGGVDLSTFNAARAAMQQIVTRCGGLDVLVNVAGGFRWQTLEDGELSTWDLMYTMNLKTAVTACKAALPHLLARAGMRSIINVGAGAAAKAGAGMGAYTASKSGVARLTESLAEELKDRGVTVNAVLPGIIDTPQNRTDMPDADFGRWVPPAAIADVITFLASDAARAVTGAMVPVFGRG